ncbi:hypothetical protein B296_00004971 [Ensete ventricosum]|uniref:Uncharacterized protein n=1 Tax=Ensete ventricosum TaxID=4639 RepID=A0A426YUH8_ENSVE|nr:hypothetical protein B296_00004971 [Ensete ventricosum]
MATLVLSLPSSFPQILLPFPIAVDPTVATSLNFFIFLHQLYPSLLLSLPNCTPSYCSTCLLPLRYTSLVGPTHALLCIAPALGRDLLCHNRLSPLPLCLCKR